MAFKQPTSNAPDSNRAARSPLPAGSRLLWSLALLAIVGSIGVRVRHARMQAAAANVKPSVDIHEAPLILEERLKTVPPALQEQEILRYARDANAAMRYAAMDELAKLRSPAAAQAMEQAFTDSDSEVRKRAMENLIQTDKPRGLRLLLMGLRDGDSWIREDAVSQLNGRIERKNSGVDKQFVPMLMTAITDSDESVASTAVHALSKLTGNPWRFSVLDKDEKRGIVIAKWRQWWQKAEAGWPVAPEYADVPPQFPIRADAAPAFEVDDVRGKTFRSDDLKGKITLINFWGTWCPPCKIEIPSLVKIDRMYRDRNVAVVGLTVGDKSAESVQTWCRANGVEYRQALSTEEARRAFGGMEEVPVSFLIDAQGRIRYQWEGERDFGTFQAAIERLLHENR